MILILLRHAIAQDREHFFLTTKLDDSLRPLTEKGRKKLRRILVRLKKWIKIKPTLIVSSPYVRAAQTAKMVKNSFGVANYEEAAELSPHCDSILFLQWLKSHGKNHRVIIVVGHEPQLSLFASFLVFGSRESRLVLKKSGALALKIESLDLIGPMSAKLEWLMQPRQVE